MVQIVKSFRNFVYFNAFRNIKIKLIKKIQKKAFNLKKLEIFIDFCRKILSTFAVYFSKIFFRIFTQNHRFYKNSYGFSEMLFSFQKILKFKAMDFDFYLTFFFDNNDLNIL